MNMSSCWMYAEIEVTMVGVIGTPLALISPSTSSPLRFLKVRAFSKVDFPAPEAPIMANSSPGRTAPLTEIL